MIQTRQDARYAILDYMSLEALRRISGSVRYNSASAMIDHIVANWDKFVKDIEDEWLKMINVTWRVATSHNVKITLEYDPHEP